MREQCKKKDLAHTPSPEDGGDKGIRPSVPFGGKRSETKRYVISHATYCNDKAARAQGGIRKRLDYFCQTFSCATQAEPNCIKTSPRLIANVAKTLRV